jgi:hypothetical protein
MAEDPSHDRQALQRACMWDPLAGTVYTSWQLGRGCWHWAGAGAVGGWRSHQKDSGMRLPLPQPGLVQVTWSSRVFWRHLGDTAGGFVGGGWLQRGG